MTYASPSSSDSALRFFTALLAPPRLADAFGVALDRSLTCGGESAMVGRGEIALAAVGGASVVSSSEESSPPARARSSASSTSISGARGGVDQELCCATMTKPASPK